MQLNIFQAKQKHREAEAFKPFEEPQPGCSNRNQEKGIGYSPVSNFNRDDDIDDELEEIEPDVSSFLVCYIYIDKM